jgi:diacylglycerol kinase (ATP)
MNDKKNIHFIINPIAGTRRIANFEQLILQHLDLTKFNPSFSFTTKESRGEEIAKEAIEKGAEVIIAVGGDGTVNTIASTLIHKNTIFGIIPNGSGNGLALCLGISTQIPKAIKIINDFNIKKIDTGIYNNKPFIGIAGIGFDAHIANLFNKNKKRGLINYVKLVVKEFFSYQEQLYQLEVDGKKLEKKLFMINICNSNQFGNNVIIAPNAYLDDGLFDLILVRKPFYYSIPKVAFMFWRNKIEKLKEVEVIKCPQFSVHSRVKSLNVDGEHVELNEPVFFKIEPLSLQILVPIS